MTTQIGSMRHRVKVQKFGVASQNSFGEDTRAMQDAATVWASISPLSGREFFEAQKQNAEVTHKIMMRYRADVSLKPKDRIKFGARVFDILAVLNLDERKIWLTVMAREVVDA